MASHDTPSAPKSPGLINSAGSTFETPKRRDDHPPGLINSTGTFETPKRRDGDPTGLINGVWPKPDVEGSSR